MSSLTLLRLLWSAAATANSQTPHVPMDPPKKTKKKAATPPPARVDTCECCGKRGTGYAHCSRCKCARYCSRACQRKDWRSHKQGGRCVVPSAVTWEEMIAMEVEGRTADNIKGFRPSNRGGGGGGRRGGGGNRGGRGRD